MKKAISALLSVLLLFGCLMAAATAVYAAGAQTYYIDSVSGSDTDSGTSPDSAWKTVENIKALSLGAGDSVLFKCGGTYTCELTLHAPVQRIFP